MKKGIYFVSIFTFLVSCAGGTDIDSEAVKQDVVAEEMTKGEMIIATALNAHGGSAYDHAHIQFDFRETVYTFKNDGDNYEYTAAYTKDSLKVFDVLNNDGFTRAIGGQLEFLKKDQIVNYSEKLNSVIYFATLPFKLKDKSVNKTFIGEIAIKGEHYDMVEVTFSEEGGGVDFKDVYYYWVNQKTSFIDYFAYSYEVNGGGIRFRAAFNPREVAGIRFQDYVNYSAPVGTAIADLPALYESGELEQISIVGTDNINSLK